MLTSEQMEELEKNINNIKNKMENEIKIPIMNIFCKNMKSKTVKKGIENKPETIKNGKEGNISKSQTITSENNTTINTDIEITETKSQKKPDSISKIDKFSFKNDKPNLEWVKGPKI